MISKNKKNKIDFWMFKAPIELKDKLDDVRIQRIKNGKDSEFLSYKRIGLAMSRHEKLLKDLINTDLLEDNNK
jgi:hypothetical protein